jgi:preprotein translocase subunit YajC
MPIDPLSIGLIVLAGVAIFFMFRNSKKRRQQEEELRAKIVPGTEIMTQGGIYGTLLSIDHEKNEALIETSPGTVLRVHSQIVSRVVEPETVDDEVVADDAVEPGLVADDAVAAEPEFGERTDEATPKRAPRKKAAE